MPTLVRLSAIMFVVDEAVHPIRRHYTPSDRVYRDVTGVPRRIGCSATERVYRDGSGALLPGLGLLDAGMCSVSEETRVQACCR